MLFWGQLRPYDLIPLSKEVGPIVEDSCFRVIET